MQNNYLIQDVDALGLTAKVLVTSELRIFELAYQDWHGQPPQQRELDRAFADYLFEGNTPCWVRAFTRNTLALCEEAGMLLPVTQAGHNLTFSVSPPEMLLAVIGLSAICLVWLAGLV